MTVIIPEDHHVQQALEEHNIGCITPDKAQSQDIRPLRIGILNIMPDVRSYEFNLLYPLGKAILQIEPIWIRLESHAYNSSSPEHMDEFYMTFKEATKDRPLDGLILTGAPVEEMDFADITYWGELDSILNYARKNIVSTLGICWGGMALAKILGIEKENFKKKLFGVFKTKNLNLLHEITGDLDDFFYCPQSRHAGYQDAALEAKKEEGEINLLAHSPETGYTIFETTDHKFLAHLGHPEYNSGRLSEEYYRDQKAGRADVDEPANFDPAAPVNNWRSHRTEFFSQWIKFVYLHATY